MKRTRCPACKGKLLEGQRIHKECIESFAEQQGAKAERAKAKSVKMAKKVERETDKARKEALKSRSDWAKEAQSEFNKFIRLRDCDLGCISCDKGSAWVGQWHASHFRSVGAATAVRFNEYNVHKSCSVCNNHLSGNISQYRPRLIEKIGLERVEFLESQNHAARYSIDYLKRIKEIYSRKYKRLERKYGNLQN